MNDRLTDRSIKIIEKGGRVLLKRGGQHFEYMHHHTNIAAGPDHTVWTNKTKLALEFFNLKWAFTIAPLYKAKVVVVYPKRKGNEKPKAIGEFANEKANVSKMHLWVDMEDYTTKCSTCLANFQGEAGIKPCPGKVLRGDSKLSFPPKPAAVRVNHYWFEASDKSSFCLNCLAIGGTEKDPLYCSSKDYTGVKSDTASSTCDKDKSYADLYPDIYESVSQAMKFFPEYKDDMLVRSIRSDLNDKSIIRTYYNEKGMAGYIQLSEINAEDQLVLIKSIIKEIINE